MPIQEDNDRDTIDPSPLRPIDEPPPGDGDPPAPLVRITRVSPIAGALAGGVDITLTGTGFQPGAEVYFGNTPSPAVTYVSGGTVRAVLPAAAQTGSVNVSLFNPDGTGATRTGGFTYVVTGTGAQAEVLGVAPLSVIEATETEITIRGRNLIEAYTNGMLALRGPTRAVVTVLSFTSSANEPDGIESLTFTLRVTASPPLEPLERMAIQVLASRRPGAASDGVFESSRQMFTVLPRARPVPLAYSSNLEAGKPNLVIVAGRNLEGSTLDIDGGGTVHLQRSDDRIIAAIVTLPDEPATSAAPQLFVRGDTGATVAQYEMSVAPSADAAASVADAPSGDQASSLAEDGGAGAINMTLTAVPGQQIVAATEQDSAVFNLNGASSASLFFDWSNFEITILDITIVLPIVHEVHLIPLFDGDSGEDLLNDLPVVAQVGRLLRLRGTGILVALHFEIIIHIRVVLIIGFVFDIWGFGLYNEFPEYGWAIGSVVIAIRIEIQILLILSFLLAAVLPQGRLREILKFNLTIEIDFTISTDGQTLQFGSHYRVNYNRIGPLSNLLPCDGRFRLASENGQTVFPDAFGGHQSFYLPQSENECCVPWNFDLQLVRFTPGGSVETLQTGFRADYCLTAAPSPRLGQIIITSEHPEPTGFPPTLVLDVEQLAALRALTVPVDANGNPTGEPPQDVRNLGYDVEFFLESPIEVVLDPASLPQGSAFAIQPGENVIHAALKPRDNETPQFTFWPGAVLGFAIARYLAEGELPRVIAGALPVVVRPSIVVEPTLAYVDAQGQLQAVTEIERYEPFEPTAVQRQYVLAVKVTVPQTGTLPSSLTIKVVSATLGQAPLGNVAPNFTFTRDRHLVDAAARFFTGTLVVKDQQATIPISRDMRGDKLIKVSGLTIQANQVERVDSQNLLHLVPPGKAVANRDVTLSVSLRAEAGSARVSLAGQPLRWTVVNDETFEEYLRGFVEVQNILSGADPTITSFRTFAGKVYEDLSKLVSPSSPPAAPTAQFLDEKGVALWKLAYQAVQASPPLLDDRPLYWARLQTIAALRAYHRRHNLGQPNIKQFERPSRGLDKVGVNFTGAPPDARKAVVTGFDPFVLNFLPDRSNPSGLNALALNARTVGSAQSPVHVRTAIFPVRYQDFDDGIVEDAVTSIIGSLVLLMTCSQGRDNFYDVERFAGKNRGRVVFDNNLKYNPGTLVINPATNLPNTVNLTDPGGRTAGGKQYYESTLPYGRVITSDPATRRLPGPQPGPPFSDDDGFIVNQFYWVLGAPDVFVPGKYRPQPTNPDDQAAYIKQPDVPDESIPIFEGSGGNFLSNEVFYRTAYVRATKQPSLASGHLHVPTLGNQPRTLGPGLLNAIERALVKFLEDRFRLSGSGDIVFPATKVNTKSAPVALVVTNPTNESITLGAVEVSPPFAFEPLGKLIVKPNSSLSLPFTFTPPRADTFSSKITVRATGGEILVTATATGVGVPAAQPQRKNVAQASAGATATGSSQYNANYPATAAINGDRFRLYQPDGRFNLWHSAIGAAKPDWLQVDFGGAKTISEINVVTLQDDHINPIDPTEATTFQTYGLRDFEVQYLSGTQWQTVPGGSVTGNNKVWRNFTFPAVTTTAIRVLVSATADGYSRIMELEAYEAPPPPANVASTLNGASVSASSQYNTNFPATAAINGDRFRLYQPDGRFNLWHSAIGAAKPDWLQVDLASSMSIGEINVVTMQDDYNNPVEPTTETTFTLYGLRDFEVQYWTGAQWQTVPGGSVTANNKVWRKFTFPPVVTSKIRVLVSATADGYSRIMEVEAYQGTPPPVNVAQASEGATARGSSQYNGPYPATAAINGDRFRLYQQNGSYNLWHSATGASKPDWLEVIFSGAKNISEVDVFMLQDDFQNALNPTEEMTFTLYGLTNFEVQYWTGAQWQTVPGGSVTANNKVWRKFIFPTVTTTKMRVLISATADGYSRVMEFEAWEQTPTPQGSTNVAAAANGATVTAQNYTQDGVYPNLHFQPSYANNGTRFITPQGDQYWRDEHGLPSWVQIDFAGAKLINEVNVFTIADYPAYTTQADPAPNQTFTQYGVTAFDVQYWTGSEWQTVPGGSVTGNNLVWRRITFAAVTTTKIRVVAKAAVDGVVRIAEIEAWGVPAPVRKNVAHVANAAIVSAQNYTQDGVYPNLHFQPAYANDGLRYIHPPSGDQYWRDEHGLPTWMQVDFYGWKIIDEINVFTIADYPAYLTQADPAPNQTFTQYGVTAFDVQYWTGSEWQTVPGGSVTGNNLVWRKFNFPPLTTSKVRVVVTGASDGVARIAEIEAWGIPSPPRKNMAHSVNGATVTAQNYTQDGVYPNLHFQPSYANNGTRFITPQGDQYWRDEHGLPSWVQIDFAGAKLINEVNVFTIADYPAYTVQGNPSATQTFTQYGVTAFDVQYWTGSEWQTVPGGSVTGNNLVWRRITFTAVTTTKIRVMAKAAVDGVVRIAEIEAWGTDAT